MAQNLPAPCFQVYAASVLASLPFRQADLAARGLVYTLLCELWVNHRLPRNPAALAKVLGFEMGEVAVALPAAMAFFNIDIDSIYCQQLEDYRMHLNEIREKQKKGGKLGAAITNKKTGRSAKPADIASKSSIANSQVYPQVEARVSNKVQPNTEKQSQNQPTMRSDLLDPFIAEYEAAESCTAGAYVRASRGG